jgi:hypothetical protein
MRSSKFWLPSVALVLGAIAVILALPPARPGSEARSPRPLAPAHAQSTRPSTSPAVPRAARAEAAPDSADPKHASLPLKRRFAAEGAARRIQERERKLDELDWSAPRPGPPAAREPPLGKREAKQTGAEKLEQTERIVALLKTRITAARAQKAALAGVPAALVSERLDARVNELEQTARLLREELTEAR